MTKAPESPDAFKQATWEDVLPFYAELTSRPLDRAVVEEWLLDWSRLEAMVSEAAAMAAFRYACDTSDPELEEAELRFAADIAPKAQEQRARLQAKLVELDYVRPGLEEVVKRFKNEMSLFREANTPLFARLSRLITEWSKVNGGLTVDWDGVETTPYQLLPRLEDLRRDVRERAFRARAQPYIAQRETFGRLFDEMLDLRQRIAANAGYANFRDYAHVEKNRFDYSPEDCLRFQDAVEEAFVPAVARLHEKRRKTLGLDSLRPWDLLVDPAGLPPLKPFEDIPTFISRTENVMARVDPVFKEELHTMSAANLLDLENRKGKAPGGYCESLDFSRLPLIFMNAVGLDTDLRTLLHESGHAFHAFAASRQPLVFQRSPGAEMSEVASMSMELLAAPFLSKADGGFYTQAETRRSLAQLLESIIVFLPHCASVDAFQHWIYTAPEGRDAAARDRKWLEIRSRFERDAIDWSGLDNERIARWYQQPHFFSSPFYYIEYGIAQLGALQVWRESLQDWSSAVRNYRAALALGSTRPLPDLFAAAGARMIFDANSMRGLVELLEEALAKATA